MKTVLVTGATRGIGAAIADAFAGPDIELILTGTDPGSVAALNEAAPAGRSYVSVDFTDPRALEAFCDRIASLEHLDACINNAGVNIIKPVEDVSPGEMDRILAINYKAPYFISKAAGHVMRKQRSGRIVNIASIWSVITKSGRSLYTGVKTGLTGLTRTMAVELAPHGVLVNCVSPGFTLTDLTAQSLSAKEIEAISSQIPMARMARPEEIARTVLFLAGEENTYLTGQNIVIDGGFTIV